MADRVVMGCCLETDRKVLPKEGTPVKLMIELP